MLSASFASAYSATATWTGSYDSAGRPAKVGLTAPTALAAALWEAPLAGTASPYDALDRVKTVKSNGGLVTTTRDYFDFSGQLKTHAVATSAGQVYGVDGMLYLASKLTARRDSGTGSTYGYVYDANGRLVSATASGGAGVLAQSYGQGYSFSDAAWPAGATVGNLERVTASGVVTHYDYLQDRLV
jgi:YD repeat-containing protein